MTDGAVTLTGKMADRSPGDMAACPVAAALGVIGTRSAMLVIREAYYGTTRFDDFAARVGVTDTVAAARLRELTEAGLLSRQPYREPGRRTRHEYVLTAMGRDLAPAVLALFDWGAKYVVTGRKPQRISHRDCGAAVHTVMCCDNGHEVSLPEVEVGVAER